MEKKKTMVQQVKELTKELEGKMENLFNSGEYEQFLRAMAKFHRYSLNNQVLILSQRQDATYVASYRTWKSLGRQVRRGEKGIRVLVPVQVRVHERKEEEKRDKENGQDSRHRLKTVYKTGYVFDLAQTEGDPLPSLGVEELSGEMPDYRRILDILMHASPVPVRFGKTKGGAKGYYHRVQKEIVISDAIPERHAVHTVLHETAHALADKNGMAARLDRAENEVVAEAVSHVVCLYLDITDPSEYSCGYIASWSSGRDMKELKASMGTIRDLSSELIDRIEKVMLKDRSSSPGQASGTG